MTEEADLDSEDVDDGGLERKPLTIREKRDLKERRRTEKEALDDALYRMEQTRPSFTPCGGCGRETCWFGAQVVYTQRIRQGPPLYGMWNRSEHYLRLRESATKQTVIRTFTRMYDYIARNLPGAMVGRVVALADGKRETRPADYNSHRVDTQR